MRSILPCAVYTFLLLDSSDLGWWKKVAEQLAAWWPDLDFRKFAEEWRESLPRELDFTHERSALERAGKALGEEFIDAGPILDLGDPKFCEENKAFRDGMFHADPHAGNVRLKVDAKAPGGARPVLLDWGLIREITDEERLGLAKVFHSLANFDIAGLFDVLESLGFSLKSELVNDTFKRDLIDKARGVVKDTVNRHKTRENAKEL
ncbi:Adck1 [Symbiodinium sp. KB8]|nr:Adck1 [Symbiodinium sp. KB8]